MQTIQPQRQIFCINIILFKNYTRNQFILQCSSNNLQPKVSQQQLITTSKDPCEMNRWILPQKKRQMKIVTARSKHRTKGKSHLGKELGKHKGKSTVEGISPTRIEFQTSTNKNRTLLSETGVTLMRPNNKVKHASDKQRVTKFESTLKYLYYTLSIRKETTFFEYNLTCQLKQTSL